MQGLYFFVIPAVVLSAMGSKAVACSVAVPSVVGAVQAADIVAIGDVASIGIDGGSDVESVVFVPDVVLKGNVTGRLRFRRPKPLPSLCEGGSVSSQPIDSGDRLVVMLSADGKGSYDELPSFAPMLMNLPSGDEEAERTVRAYLSFAIENGIDPVEIRVHGKQEYVMGEEVVVDVSVTNRLKIPIITSMDSSMVSDLPSVEFVVNGLGFDSPASQVGLQIVPAETTIDMTVVLQSYFGELGVSQYTFTAYVQLPVNRSGTPFTDIRGKEARFRFSVTVGTNVEKQAWGEVKQFLSP